MFEELKIKGYFCCDCERKAKVEHKNIRCIYNLATFCIKCAEKHLCDGGDLKEKQEGQ